MVAQTRMVTRAVGIGLLRWLIPFVIAFLVFPLNKANAPHCLKMQELPGTP